MVARSILLRHPRRHKILSASLPKSPERLRRLATSQHAKQPTSSPQPPTPMKENKSWLTQQVEASPTVKKAFLGFTNVLGYGSTKQVAGRRAFSIYDQICAVRADEDREFWQNDCFLPPTFQSWFTITNLHIWMLTVRIRALPPAHGKAYQQALIDHFFMDIEDRMRNVLQPPSSATESKPYTFHSQFYVNPNAYDPNARSPDGKPKPRVRAPDRIVNRQMKIFKEQWAGMGFSFDLGLVKGDMEMAGAVWRNILGARGAQGIAYPSSSSASPTYRLAVNLVGGEVVNVAKIDLEKEEVKDDGSGVHDFPPSEADKYLTYPTVMLDIVGYVRRELARLEKVSDEDIISGDWTKLKFGRGNQHFRITARSFETALPCRSGLQGRESHMPATMTIYLISGASRGLGFAFASAILAKDDSSFVYAGARNLLDTPLNELQMKYPGRLSIVRCVSADEEGNKAIAKEIEERHGRVDVVIANAAISVHHGGVHETPLTVMEDHFRTNVLGPLALFQATFHLLKASHTFGSTPRFITISSEVGSLQGYFVQQKDVGVLPYGTTKAALNWMTRKIHFENDWIVAFPLTPGVIKTQMLLDTAANDKSGRIQPVVNSAMEPIEAANMLLEIISTSTRETHGGEFFNRNGKKVEW